MVQDADDSELNKMEFKCNSCNKNFNSEESLNQHNAASHANEKKEGKASMRKYLIIGIIILIIIFSSFGVYSYMKKPGQYDEFVKCLTDKEVIIYGNDYCSYTNQQLNFFGKSQKYLNYVKCVDNENLCDEKGVEITPTWEINGETYSGIQSLEKLSELTGCEI